MQKLPKIPVQESLMASFGGFSEFVGEVGTQLRHQYGCAFVKPEMKPVKIHFYTYTTRLPRVFLNFFLVFRFDL